MFRSVLTASVLAFLMWRCPSEAQIVNHPPSGTTGTFMGIHMTIQSGIESNGLMIHRNVLGKPCLNVEAAAVAHTINPNIFDHFLSIKNICSQAIKLRLCYANSDHCTEIEVQAYQTKDKIIGVDTSKYFRVTWQEHFNGPCATLNCW